jgi:uncharacterized protein (DUF2147 family)
MRPRPLMIAAALLSVIGAGPTRAAEPTAAGLWQATDQESGKPSGWFLIRDHDGVYDGAIVKMYLKPGESPDVVCDQCTDDRRDKPWLGLDIIRGMKRDGLTYKDGTILDPRNGRIYNAMMTLTPDGQTLVVRGYLGISLFGQNQYWTRLPDSAYNELDPRFNPKRPPGAANKPQGAQKPDNNSARR